MSEIKERKPLLKVEHLEQYFKFGKHYLKAVDDVNFEIYKGEVFGLVGESGCGKTTTGRSIIRLYDITGGSVYFDGTRICAGVRNYKQGIKDATKEYKAFAKKIAEDLKNSAISPEDAKTQLKEAENKMNEVVRENINNIKLARYDHRNCNREFAKNEMKKAAERYDALINEAKTKYTGEELTNKLQELEAEKKNKYIKSKAIMSCL